MSRPLAIPRTCRAATASMTSSNTPTRARGGTSLHAPLGVENLMPVKLHLGAQAVGRSSGLRDPVEFLLQRDRWWSANEQRRHGEPVVGAGLVHICQQHPRIVRLDPAGFGS